MPALRGAIPGDAGHDLTPMDAPAPKPAEVRRPEAVPLSEEQKWNYQKDIDRFEEEKFASRHSFPTKLLGWMLIAGFGLQIAGGISGNHYNFGGPIFLFAGIYVLNGSQSSLRFATFLIGPAAIAGLLETAWALALGRPVEIGSGWHDFRDLKFWTMWVSPTMFFVAESIIAICVFRLRKIPFWTKTVRLWAVIVAVLLLVKAGTGIRDLLRERELRKTFSKDLQAARTFIFRGGTVPFGQNAIEASPPVLRIWSQHKSGFRSESLYEAPPREPSRSEKLYEYEEWFKDPSGEWGKLEMEVILPENP